ncbi:MAG: hypothetical protein APF81_10395 [Desulfosporosinus sp. BRH_c37]|nr:MAG: hypothetical protein APF81_10395 [Desulfosporosinus sp. BRH_c37]
MAIGDVTQKKLLAQALSTTNTANAITGAESKVTTITSITLVNTSASTRTVTFIYVWYGCREYLSNNSPGGFRNRDSNWIGISINFRHITTYFKTLNDLSNTKATFPIKNLGLL